jgi:hypothetical protein
MLRPIGVHLLYMIVSDLASSTAAHSQNSINFNSEELGEWVEHEWTSANVPEMKRPLASLYMHILQKKGAGDEIASFQKDQDEATRVKETKDQYTLWKAVSASLLRMLGLSNISTRSGQGCIIDSSLAHCRIASIEVQKHAVVFDSTEDGGGTSPLYLLA